MVDSIDSFPQLEYTKVNLLQIYSTMIFGPLNYSKEISRYYNWIILKQVISIVYS